MVISELLPDLCLILLLLADSSLHLHRWWSNHEHALPEPSGPEKPRCLVSVDLVPGRSSGLPSVFVCPYGSFMGQQIADSSFFFYCLSLRWDRKNNPEPWNKMEPTQQYKVLLVMQYLQKYLLIAPHSLTFFIILYCQKRISFKGNTHRACYLVAKSVLPCHTDCTCLCMFPAVCS